MRAPQPETTSDLAILLEPVSKLAKSNAYPYGLTDHMIATLNDAGINTVGDLADTSDGRLDELPSIGPAKVRRIKNVIGQAVWM